MQVKRRNRGMKSIASVVTALLLLLMSFGSSGVTSSAYGASRSVGGVALASAGAPQKLRCHRDMTPTLAEFQRYGVSVRVTLAVRQRYGSTLRA